tara:strand:+ start:566 stop:949 length:384 start_codon:yes stop_codon:yes gene_type:complete
MTLRTVIVAGLATAALSACANDPYRYDFDDNPPGPRGGWGTNWENPPGPVGGPGASPDRYYRHSESRYEFSPRRYGYYFNRDLGYYHPDFGWMDNRRMCWRDEAWSPSPRYSTRWRTPGVPTRYRRC